MGTATDEALLATINVLSGQVAEMRKELAELRTQNRTPEGPNPPLSEALDAYLRDVAIRRKSAFAKNTRVTFKCALRELGAGVLIRDLTLSRIDEVTDSWLTRGRVGAGRGIAHSTINMTWGRIKTALSWAVNRGLIGSNPLERWRALPTSGFATRKRRALSDEEIVRLIEALRHLDAEAQRYWWASRCIETHARSRAWRAKIRPWRLPQAPLFELLVGTGLRLGEAVRLVWADLDLVRLTLTIRAENAKNGTQAILPILEDLAATLRSLRDEQARAFGRRPAEDGMVFLSPKRTTYGICTYGNLRRRFYDALELAGIPRRDSKGESIDIHGLRVSYISRLLRSGVPVASAQKLARHKTVALTLNTYGRFGVEDLRRSILGVPAIAYGAPTNEQAPIPVPVTTLPVRGLGGENPC